MQRSHPVPLCAPPTARPFYSDWLATRLLLHGAGEISVGRWVAWRARDITTKAEREAPIREVVGLCVRATYLRISSLV